LKSSGEFRWAAVLSAKPSERSKEHQAQAPTDDGGRYAQVTGVAVGLLLAAGATPALAWEPTKRVEIVVAAGAGGASDQMARMMQAAIQKNGLMKAPIVVSLKGGASGAEALMYMKSSDGDANKVLIGLFPDLHAAALGENSLQLARPHTRGRRGDGSVRPVGQCGRSKVGQGLHRRCEGCRVSFKMGGTGSKREDMCSRYSWKKKTGAKFSYLPYKSGGEAATQLVGTTRIQRQ